MKDRIYGLDLLRGIFAFAVMWFHITDWAFGKSLEVVGIYAVSGFFVISGFSLQHVYGNLCTAKEVKNFFVKRYLRIAPLYYVVIALTIFPGIIKTIVWHFMYGQSAVLVVSFSDVFYNILLCFGLISPGKTSVVCGGWSIGVEFVFYVLFPIIVLVLRNDLKSTIILCVITLFLHLIFTSSIDYSLSQVEVWYNYVNVVNFFVYFCFGILGSCIYSRCVGVSRTNYHYNSYLLFAITIITIFIVYLGLSCTPKDINSQYLLVVRRWDVIIALLTILLVYLSSLVNFCSKFSMKLAGFFGNISYSLYLLHPLLFKYFHFTYAKSHIFHSEGFVSIATFISVLVVCPLLSIFIYNKFELPARCNLLRKFYGSDADINSNTKFVEICT